MIVVGVIASKHATNVGDFVLGGRKVGPWLTAFAYGTSYFSAVVFVGYAAVRMRYGISATWIGIGNALIGSLLPWIVLGGRTRTMTKHLNSATMPDFFGRRFDSKAIKIAAAVISFIFWYLIQLRFIMAYLDFLKWPLIFLTGYVYWVWPPLQGFM